MDSTVGLQGSPKPDSSTVPNTASNAKDHGNAPRRLVRDCEILCLFLGKSVNFSANA